MEALDYRPPSARRRVGLAVLATWLLVWAQAATAAAAPEPSTRSEVVRAAVPVGAKALDDGPALMAWRHGGTHQVDGSTVDWRLCEEYVDRGRSACVGDKGVGDPPEDSCYRAGRTVVSNVADPDDPANTAIKIEANGAADGGPPANNHAIYAADVHDLSGLSSIVVYRLRARIPLDGPDTVQVGPEVSIQDTGPDGVTRIAGLQHRTSKHPKPTGPTNGWRIWVPDADADDAGHWSHLPLGGSPPPAQEPGSWATIALTVDLATGRYRSVVIDPDGPEPAAKVVLDAAIPTTPARPGSATKVSFTLEAESLYVHCDDPDAAWIAGHILYDDLRILVKPPR